MARTAAEDDADSQATTAGPAAATVCAAITEAAATDAGAGAKSLMVPAAAEDDVGSAATTAGSATATVCAAVVKEEPEAVLEAAERREETGELVAMVTRSFAAAAALLLLVPLTDSIPPPVASV